MYFDFISCFVFSHKDQDKNSRNCLTISKLNTIIQILLNYKYGIHQRIVASGRDFLKRMLSKDMELSVSQTLDEFMTEILKPFSEVNLLDSTQISLPEELSERWSGSGGSASKPGMKLHLMLDYKSGKYEKITIEEGKLSDHSYIEILYISELISEDQVCKLK